MVDKELRFDKAPTRVPDILTGREKRRLRRKAKSKVKTNR